MTILKKLYNADSKHDAFRMLSKNPQWALKPIQIIAESDEVSKEDKWYIARIQPSNIANQTLYICFCTLTMYLNKPDEFPGHWMELSSLRDEDPNLTDFAYKIAEEFDDTHAGLSGEEYRNTLDAFIDQKIRDLQ